MNSLHVDTEIIDLIVDGVYKTNHGVVVMDEYAGPVFIKEDPEMSTDTRYKDWWTSPSDRKQGFLDLSDDLPEILDAWEHYKYKVICMNCNLQYHSRLGFCPNC